jgi:hypothetical protein
MRYRILTADNDYSFGNGQADFYHDVPEAVGQSVLTRLLLWLGEWYLDTSAGTPYLEGILGKYSQTNANITIQDQVQQTTGVTDISSYDSELNADTRALSVQLSIDTIYGPTAVQIANYVNF